MISKGCKSIFPIQHQEIWDRYKQHVQAFWTPEEVSLQDDLRDLKTLNDDTQNLTPQIVIYSHSKIKFVCTYIVQLRDREKWKF